MKKLYFLFIILALIYACNKNDDNPVPTKPQSATFELLPMLDSTKQHRSSANAMSADGSVIVGLNHGLVDVDKNAVKWVNGKVMALPEVGEDGVTILYPIASGISSDGSVIVGMGGSRDSNGIGGLSPLLWKDNKAYPLTMPNAPVVYPADEFDVSAGGNVIVGTVLIGPDDWSSAEYAYYWAPEPHRLDTGQANAITDDGSVIVGYHRYYNADEHERITRAFRRENGVLMDLESSSEIIPTNAFAITDDASIIVGSGHLPGDEYRSMAFRWKNGELKALGTRSSGESGNPPATALAVSADGSVIVGSGSIADRFGAFIWTESEGMKNLQQVLEEDYGVDFSGLTLTEATCISADGRIIAGNAKREGDTYETVAWRVIFSN